MADANTGYIKLFRSLIDWEWYDDSVTLRVWIHLLLKANHEDRRWHGVEIKRGQLITSTEKLAKELHISRQQARRAISNLQTSGEITSKATNKWTLINVEKYDDFQGWNPRSNQQTNQQTTSNPTNKQPTKNQQATTNNNDNNYENERRNNYTRSRARNSVSSILEQLEEKYRLEEDGST